MSLFDWVAAGCLSQDVELPWFSGSYSSTMGDAMGVTFGGRHTHIFGSEIKLVCDPEDMALFKLAEALPLVTALAGGVGGQTTFVYGSNTAATYVGPKVTIQRAPSAGKTSKYMLAHKLADDADGDNEIDRVTTGVVAALSALICATAAALELALHFRYPLLGSGDEEAEESYGKTPETLKTCATMITDRLMALLKEIECKGSWANFAEEFSKEAWAEVGLALAIGGAFFPPLFLGFVWTTATAFIIQKALENAAQAA